jgi:hypothetical protein
MYVPLKWFLFKAIRRNWLFRLCDLKYLKGMRSWIITFDNIIIQNESSMYCQVVSFLTDIKMTTFCKYSFQRWLRLTMFQEIVFNVQQIWILAWFVKRQNIAGLCQQTFYWRKKSNYFKKIAVWQSDSIYL